MSGHSKWSTIKHRKGAQDAKRSKIFTKVIKEITVAARLGGSDAESNPRLRSAVTWARSVNMPNDNVNKAIKKDVAGDEGTNFENITYEGYGQHQVTVIVDCLTDNKNRTTSSIRSIFNKAGGNLGAANSVMYGFDRVGIIEVEKSTVDEDTLTEYILDAGAEDIDYSDNELYEIKTGSNDLHKIQTYLEKQRIYVKSAQLTLVAQNLLAIEDVQHLKTVLQFIEKLEDDEDVQKVYSNLNLTEANN